MNEDVYAKIRRAIDRAPRNAYVAELHLQVIKFAGVLENVTGKQFCERLGISPAWGAEFTKMKKIAPRLREAGLSLDQI